MTPVGTRQSQQACRRAATAPGAGRVGQDDGGQGGLHQDDGGQGGLHEGILDILGMVSTVPGQSRDGHEKS
jgi:hypothetical protein